LTDYLSRKLLLKLLETNSPQSELLNNELTPLPDAHSTADHISEVSPVQARSLLAPSNFLVTRERVPLYGGIFRTTLEPKISAQLSAFLRGVAEPAGLRPKFWRQLNTGLISAELRCGPTVVRRWSGNGKEEDTLVSCLEGYTVELLVQMRCVGRISTVMSCFNTLKISATFSVRCNIGFSSAVRDDTNAFEAARNGQIVTLRNLLELRKASVTDFISSGNTLLHVRDSMSTSIMHLLLS
jgi:hypothetical protein